MLVLCVSVLVLDILAVDLPKIADPGELVSAPKGIEVHLGGHAANVSIDLRRLGLLEGDVGVAGAVGQDIFGDFVENELKSSGVVAHLQRVRGTCTGKCVILVVKGEDRRFHSESSPAPSPRHVLSILKRLKPRIFYVGTAGVMAQLDYALKDIFRKAKEMGCTTFVDPVVPHSHGWNYLDEALRWVDIFHSNDVEAASFTGERDPEAALEAILEKGIGMAIVSLGEGGLLAANRRYKLRMPAFKVQVLDPTGAGDAFTSGVIQGLLQIGLKKPFKVAELARDKLLRALVYGEAAGAACVMEIGTTSGVTRSRVDALMKSQENRVLDRASIEEIS